MAYKIQISEILANLAEFKGKDSTKKKVEWLQKNTSSTLAMVLHHAFDPKIVYKLPPGAPPYKVSDAPAGLGEASLYPETRRLSYLFHNPPPGLRKSQLEGLFISLLEGLHADEAKIVLAMKDKTLHKLYPALTEDIVRKAFPALLP